MRCLVCVFSGRSVGRAFAEPPMFHPHALMHVLISRSLARSLLAVCTTNPALWATASDLDAVRRGQVCQIRGILIFFFKPIVQLTYLRCSCPKTTDIFEAIAPSCSAVMRREELHIESFFTFLRVLNS